MEKWKSRLQQGVVVLEDPRFLRRQNEADLTSHSKPVATGPPAAQTISTKNPHRVEATIKHQTRPLNKRSITAEPISKRIKAELIEDNGSDISTILLPPVSVKTEPTEAGTSSRQSKKWFLQKFVDGVISGDRINVSDIGFPVPIGRDALKVKIYLDGPKQKHISRYHAELHECGDGFLRVKCFSNNGVLINQSDFLGIGESALLKNSDTFSLGDVSDEYRDTIQVVMFAVRCEAVGRRLLAAEFGVESHALSSASECGEPDRKPFLGSSIACPILIDDDDEDAAQGLHDTSAADNNEGLAALLMRFKEEPLDEDDAQVDRSPVGSSLSRDNPQNVSSRCSSGEANVEARQPLEKFTNVSAKKQSLARDRASTKPFASCGRSSTEPPKRDVGSSVQPTMRTCPNFQPTFNAYRQCLLHLNLNDGVDDPSQSSERVFVEFLRQFRTSTALRDVTRRLFSFFCLEAAARVRSAWKKTPQATPTSRKAAVVSQARLTADVFRLTLVVPEDGSCRFTDCTALKLCANFVRIGGSEPRRRTLLGLINKCENIDRRRRSGGIQMPQLLLENGRSASDIVDVIEVDLDKSIFNGEKLHAESLIEISRVCDVRELKKILCLRQIPDAYCHFLRGIKSVNIWSPNDSLKSSRYHEQMARVTRLSMFTSEQTAVMCGALSLLATPVTAVSMMLVEGLAGTGKSTVLLETALECVIAKPSQTVLIFCKWSVAADVITQNLLDTVQRRKLKLNDSGKPIVICRAGGSHVPRVQRVCLFTLLEEKRKSVLQQEIERKQKSLQEQTKRIADLKLSLENQLEKLAPFMKTRKLSEIAQLEVALAAERKEIDILMDRRSQCAARLQNIPKATAVLENSNILVCATADIETNIVGQAFKSSGPAKVSVVLIDQAHQVLLPDLVPIMQLNCSRLIMFGDRYQSAFLKHVIRHKKLREHNPHVPSDFVKSCGRYPNKRFCLTKHFRLRSPLREIVSDLFVRTPASPSLMNFNGQISTASDLSTVTLFDVDDESEEELVVLRVVQALKKVQSKVHLLLTTQSPPNKFQTIHKKVVEDRGPLMIMRILEHIETEHISVLIIPLFDAALVDDINRDPTILYSLLTRASKAVILIGCFPQLKSHCSLLDRFAEQSKLAGRFFHVDARSFMKVSLAEVLMHLRP